MDTRSTTPATRWPIRTTCFALFAIACSLLAWVLARERAAQLGSHLVLAVQKGDSVTAMELLAAGADVDARSDEAEDISTLADRLRTILGGRRPAAPICDPQFKGATSLIIAVRRSNLSLVRVLIAHHADAKRQDSFGRLAAYYALHEVQILESDEMPARPANPSAYAIRALLVAPGEEVR